MPTGRCLLKEHRVYLGTRPIPITLFSVQRELHSRIREFTSRRGVLVAIRYKDEGKQMFGITEGRYVVLSLSYTQPELDSCLPKSSDLAAFICQAATAACQDGRCLEALGMAQRALTVKAECAQAHFLVGTAVDELGLFNDAIREYQSALRINPDFVEAHHNLGWRHLGLTVPRAVRGNLPTYGGNRQHFPRYWGVPASKILWVTTSHSGCATPTYTGMPVGRMIQ